MTVPRLDDVHDPITLVARDPRTAHRQAESALAESRGPRHRSTALRLLGLARRELGDPRSAHRLLRQSAAVAARAGLPECAAHARSSRLGLLALGGTGTGGLAGGTLARLAGSAPSARASVRLHHGLAAAQQGRFGAAVAGFDAAMARLRPGDDDRLLAGVLSNRGLALAYSGRLSESAEDLQRALALAEEHALGHLRGLTLQNLGCLSVREGDIPGAVSRFAEATRLVPASRRAALCLDRADALLTAGMLNDAGRLLAPLAGGLAGGSRSDEAIAQLLRAKVHLGRNDRGAARDQARRVRGAFPADSLWARLAALVEWSAQYVGDPPHRHRPSVSRPAPRPPLRDAGSRTSAASPGPNTNRVGPDRPPEAGPSAGHHPVAADRARHGAGPSGQHDSPAEGGQAAQAPATAPDTADRHHPPTTAQDDSAQASASAHASPTTADTADHPRPPSPPASGESDPAEDGRSAGTSPTTADTADHPRPPSPSGSGERWVGVPRLFLGDEEGGSGWVSVAEGTARAVARCVPSAPLGPLALAVPRAHHAAALRALARGDHHGARRALWRAGSVPAAATRHVELLAHDHAHDREVAAAGVAAALRAGDAVAALEWAERARDLPRPPAPCRDGEWVRLLDRCRAAHARARSGDEAAAVELRGLAARLGVAQWHGACVATPRRRPDPLHPLTDGLAERLGDRALLCYAQGHGEHAAITLVDGRARAHPLRPVAEVADAVAKLVYSARRDAMAAGHAADSDLPRRAARAERLLLAGVDAAVGDRPLVICPTAYARALPWGMLPALRGREVTVAASARAWLAQRERAHEVTIAASDRARLARRERARNVTAASGRARPAQRASPGSGRASRVLLVAGSELAGAAAEVAALRWRYPEASVLAGGDAGVAAVLGGLGWADLAHVSAHGAAPADTPMLSGVLLADGPLYAYDLERLPRVPALTVLSSCWVGGCGPSPAGVPLGLGASVLALGGATVVAGVLPVRDRETGPAMVGFHAALRAGATPARAVADHLANSGFVCFGAG